MKARGRGVPLLAVLAGAALLTAATPPAWAAWTPLLVVPGLALQCAVATGARRPFLASWLLGALHVGAFSWSLRHVTYAGWLAVAVLGGVYTIGVAAATRRLEARLGALAFGLAVAAASWLRAEMPGIAYPHGQPCHVLWQWPRLCQAVALGGEPLGNALLATIGAAAARCWSAWRIGVPAFVPARRTLAFALAAFAAATAVEWSAGSAAARTTVAVAAIEPGLHLADAFADIAPHDQRAFKRRWAELVRTRLLEPTLRIAGAEADAPPELVLWPESAVPYAVEESHGELRFDALRGVLVLANDVRLCFGTEVLRDDERTTPAAVLVDELGAFVAHQEKQCLVPAGETLPGIEWLPAGLAARVRGWLQTTVGLPAALPGRALPPLRLPPVAGRPAVPFTALVCYDNAFPGVIAAAVADGARFCAVLSNESWYRGGGELDQLAAITVLRAIAARVPIVRCTTDGTTMAVDRDGRILQALPPAPSPQPAARILRIDLPLGDGHLPPMARLHPWLGWGAVVFSAFAVLLGSRLAPRRWGRLLGPDPATAEPGEASPGPSAGGS